MSTEFKAGDLVFEVSTGFGIKLIVLDFNNQRLRPVMGDYAVYDKDSRRHEADFIPSIIHATPENRQALVTLYGEDAVPKLPLRGNDLAIRLLGCQKYVLAWVGMDSDCEARDDGIVDIVIGYENSYFVNHNGEMFRYAIPVDNHGNEITKIGGNNE